MKKLFFAAYTLILVASAPAVFACYLTKDNKATSAKKTVSTEKTAADEDAAAASGVTMLIPVQ